MGIMRTQTMGCKRDWWRRTLNDREHRK